MILEKIEKICRERKMPISKLEEAAGLGNATVRAWGKSFPRVDKLKAVADVLGVSIDYLLRDDKNEESA